MENDHTTKPPRSATDPNFGGASAGAQNGGIIDAGAADNETGYEDALVGRKGGMVKNETNDSYVDTSEFDSADAASGTEGLGGLQNR